MRAGISFSFFRERSGIRAAKCGPFPLGEENLEKNIPCLEKYAIFLERDENPNF